MRINEPNLEVAFSGFKAIYDQAFENAVSHKDTVAMTINSQASEENYGWLGQFPALREWIGERHQKKLASHGFKIVNRKFESTAKVKRDDFSDDRYGIHKPMFSEMGRVAKQHADTLIFELLAKGFITECFDGRPFFSESHPQSQFPDDPISPPISNMQDGLEPAWFLIDGSKGLRPIIWQEREDYEFASITDPQNYNVFMKDDFLYGIRARVNCGFGLWQLAFGSMAELTPENYAAARAAMMQFTGDQGQLLGTMPTHLVVPAALEAKGRALINADTVNNTSNIWRGSAELIVTPFLGA